MKKRLAALLVVLSLVFGLCSFTVWADDETPQQTENTVTVTFIEEVSSQELVWTCTAGEEITLPECLFDIPEDYDTFTGWYDGDGILWSAGEVYTVTEDTYFFAMFGYDDGKNDPDGNEYPAAEAGDTYTVYVEAGGVTYYSFTPEESGYYVFYTVSDDYDTYMYLYDSDFEYLRGNDDGGSGLNAKIKYYFDAGETYYVGLAFYSDSTEGSYDFVCERYYPAVSAQLILTTDYVELIEGIDSDTIEDENGEDYEHYYLESDNFSYGDQIIVTYEDNTTETYTFDGSDFYNDAGENIGSLYDETDYYVQYYNHWEVGSTYEMTMCLEDLDYVIVTVPVKIIENPYISAQVSLSSGLTLEQGLDSWLVYDEDEGAFFDCYSPYNLMFSEGDTVTITCNDGSVIVYTYYIEEYTEEYDGEVYTYYDYGFVSEDGDWLSYGFRGYYDMQYEEHWETGSTYTVSMYLYDYALTVDIPVTIAENPYSGATVTFNFTKNIVLSECTDAWTDYYYDEDTGEEEEYCYYSFWSIDFTEGDQIIITFADGTAEVYAWSICYTYTYTDDDGTEITEYEYDFIDEDGNYLDYSVYSDQYYSHWYAGNTYSYIFVIEDYGISADLPVTVSDHDWELTEVITAATCTEEGSGTYTCADCGETKTDVIAAAGHSYEVTEYVEATETTDGYIVYTCSVCGDTYTEVIAAAGSTSGTSGTSGSSSGEDGTSPETGDENSLALWLILAVLAAAGAGTGLVRRRFE